MHNALPANLFGHTYILKVTQQPINTGAQGFTATPASQPKRTWRTVEEFLLDRITKRTRIASPLGVHSYCRKCMIV